MGQAIVLSQEPGYPCSHLLLPSPQAEATYGLHQLLTLSLIKFYAALGQYSSKC